MDLREKLKAKTLQPIEYQRVNPVQNQEHETDQTWQGQDFVPKMETEQLEIFKMGSKTYDFATPKVTAMALNETLQNSCWIHNTHCKEVRLWGKVRKRTSTFLTNQCKLSRPYFHPSPSGLSFVCPFGGYSYKTPSSPPASASKYKDQHCTATPD